MMTLWVILAFLGVIILVVIYEVLWWFWPYSIVFCKMLGCDWFVLPVGADFTCLRLANLLWLSGCLQTTSLCGSILNRTGEDCVSGTAYIFLLVVSLQGG